MILDHYHYIMLLKFPADRFHVIDSAPLIISKVSCNVCEKILQIFGQSAKKGVPTEVSFSLL